MRERFSLPTTTTDSVLDRPARTELSKIIRRFLNDELSAFEFDAALDPFHRSADPTVRFIAEEAWCYYDDCADHLVVLTKGQWDFFQRLLLVLESDRQISVTRVRHWSWTQLLALGCLASLGACAWRLGWGEHLLLCAIPYGIVSILISRISSPRPTISAAEQRLIPFPSFADLRATYQATANYVKQRYPAALIDRQMRSPLAEFALRLQMYAHWLISPPFRLLDQSLPMIETRVTLAGGKPSYR